MKIAQQVTVVVQMQVKSDAKPVLLIPVLFCETKSFRFIETGLC